MVPARGLEPPRLAAQALNLLRMPVPPRGHYEEYYNQIESLVNSNCFDILQIREELPDRAFDPAMQRGRRKRTSQARARQFDFERLTIVTNHLDGTAVVIIDVRAD